jgi:hypothetical protein
MTHPTTSPLLNSRVHPIIYRGEVVAVAGPRGCHLRDDVDRETYRMAAAMCLFHREVVDGRMPGPFTSEFAERWAEAFVAAGRGHRSDA